MLVYGLSGFFLIMIISMGAQIYLTACDTHKMAYLWLKGWTIRATEKPANGMTSNVYYEFKSTKCDEWLSLNEAYKEQKLVDKEFFGNYSP